MSDPLSAHFEDIEVGQVIPLGACAVDGEALEVFAERFAPGWDVAYGAPDALVYALWSRLAAEKAAGDMKAAAEKAVTVEQIEVGKVKAKQTRKAAEKKAVKDEKAAAKAAKKESKAAQKPAAKLKTVKLNMVFQSPWGSEITPEQIALKVPKESTDVYVKIDENKIYWVGKNGETGAVDIW